MNLQANINSLIGSAAALGSVGKISATNKAVASQQQSFQTDFMSKFGEFVDTQRMAMKRMEKIGKDVFRQKQQFKKYFEGKKEGKVNG